MKFIRLTPTEYKKGGWTTTETPLYINISEIEHLTLNADGKTIVKMKSSGTEHTVDEPLLDVRRRLGRILRETEV